MKKILGCILFVLLTGFVSTASAIAATIVFEDFEDATVVYTATPADAFGDAASNDYYGRVGGAGGGTIPVSNSYSSLPSGTGFYGAQDTDGALPSATTNINLEIFGINISNASNLGFEIYVAEDDSGITEDWDANSSFSVEFQIDGGGFITLFAIESELGTDINPETNERPREDQDLNGVGEGIEITDTFALFAKSIFGTGSTLDLRINIDNLDAAGEDIAIDNIRVTGDLSPVPIPAAVWLFGSGLLGLVGMARRKKT